MTVAGITFLVRDGGAAAPPDLDATANDDAELLALRAEVCGAGAGGGEAARQLRVRRRQPGFVLAEARHGGYLVAYAAGLPLRTSTSWWRDLTTPLPADVTTEYPGRTFALAELLVRASWRRQGIGRALHDLILDGRQEERATATVPPGAAAAQAAFKRWGWRRIARTRAPDTPDTPGVSGETSDNGATDVPVLDVLITDVR